MSYHPICEEGYSYVLYESACNSIIMSDCRAIFLSQKHLLVDAFSNFYSDEMFSCTIHTRTHIHTCCSSLGVGSKVPESWLEGVHFTLDAASKFEKNELVITPRGDGSRRLARVIGIVPDEVSLPNYEATGSGNMQ